MIKSLRRIYPLYIVADVLAMAVGFYLPFFLKYHAAASFPRDLHPVNFREYSAAYLIWTIFLFLFFKRRNLFSTDRSLSIPKESFRVFISVCYSALLVSTVIFFAQYKFFSREVFLENAALLCILLSLWRAVKRIIVRQLIARGFHNINVLIAGATVAGRTFLAEIQKIPWLGFKVIGFLDDTHAGLVDGIPVVGTLSDFNVVAKKHFVEEIIIAIPSEEGAVSELMQKARDYGLAIRMIPEHFEERLPILDVSYLGVIPLLTYRERKYPPAALVLKRLLDFIGSLISLVLFAPLWMAIALLIKLDSEGSVLYVRERIGLKGRPFRFYKFRSMVKDADRLKPALLGKNEVKDGIIFKIKKDPRITPVGRLLRKYSLDEIPQLLNVLKGDMSLVGPRPPLPEEVGCYSHLYMDRLSVRPGITGLSQIKGRSKLTFRQWVKWDLWYVNNWTFGLDLKILWWTLPAVIKGRGAY